jgi:hypothetical protein
LADEIHKPEESSDIFVELTNFEKTALNDVSLLRYQLIDELPLNHILRDKISVIEYVDEKVPDTFGECYRGKGKTGDKLKIYNHQGKSEEYERWHMHHTIFHEIAHSVYYHLRNKTLARWMELIDFEHPEDLLVNNPMINPRHNPISIKDGDDYFTRVSEEEFAEMYTCYVQRPGFVNDFYPQKYVFFRLNVFYNREYPDYTGKEPEYL